MRRKKNIEVMDYDYIRKRINLIIDARDKALFAAMYGTACRVSEIAELEKENVKIETVKVEELKKSTVLLTLTIPNRKNRTVSVKSPPIPFVEYWIIEPILDWLDMCHTDRLFNIGTRQIRKLSHKYFDTHPHIFRHSRVTHLIKKFNAHPSLVRKICGWSDDKPLITYEHLLWGDVAKIWK